MVGEEVVPCQGSRTWATPCDVGPKNTTQTKVQVQRQEALTVCVRGARVVRACVLCRCCGVSQNTYHTLKDMRLVLVDGTVLDTADPHSCASFLKVGGVGWGAL